MVHLSVFHLFFTCPSTFLSHHSHLFFIVPRLWMFSRYRSHPLKLTHPPSTPLAAHSKLWLSVIGGSDSGKQWSGQVITGQANRGPMKHENLPSSKWYSHIYWEIYRQTAGQKRRQRWKHMQTRTTEVYRRFFPKNNNCKHAEVLNKHRQPYTILHTHINAHTACTVIPSFSVQC